MTGLGKYLRSIARDIHVYPGIPVDCPGRNICMKVRNDD